MSDGHLLPEGEIQIDNVPNNPLYFMIMGYPIYLAPQFPPTELTPELQAGVGDIYLMFTQFPKTDQEKLMYKLAMWQVFM